MLAGVMVQLGVQMGIHRAYDVQDFVKVPIRLSAGEHVEWVRTWQACNIVAQRWVFFHPLYPHSQLTSL
jgi:transcriptional regulatory protein LEU3